jgi:hypothetical protein
MGYNLEAQKTLIADFERYSGNKTLRRAFDTDHVAKRF